jgi:hypothetical protein
MGLMILSELKNYLEHHGQAGILDLSHRFDAEPDALRGMLAQWIRKGKVRRVDTVGGCALRGAGRCSCEHADPLASEIYEWVRPGVVRILPFSGNSCSK